MAKAKAKLGAKTAFLQCNALHLRSKGIAMLFETQVSKKCTYDLLQIQNILCVIFDACVYMSILLLFIFYIIKKKKLLKYDLDIQLLNIKKRVDLFCLCCIYKTSPLELMHRVLLLHNVQQQSIKASCLCKNITIAFYEWIEETLVNQINAQ